VNKTFIVRKANVGFISVAETVAPPPPPPPPPTQLIQPVHAMPDAALMRKVIS
jgi:hypothetical protein